jgi:hypothetical protein
MRWCPVPLRVALTSPVAPQVVARYVIASRLQEVSLAHIVREQNSTLTPTLSLAKGEEAISIPLPPEGRGQDEGGDGREQHVRE